MVVYHVGRVSLIALLNVSPWIQCLCRVHLIQQIRGIGAIIMDKRTWWILLQLRSEGDFQMVVFFVPEGRKFIFFLGRY